MHAQRLYERIPNTLEPLFIRGAGHNDCELYEEYLIRLEYLVHIEVESSNLLHLARESNPANQNIRSIYRLSRFLPWTRRSDPKSGQILPNRITSKPKPLKDESNEQSSTLGTNSYTHFHDKTLKSFTPVWMRKRGLHGSYRYVHKNGEKRKCKRIHSLSTISSNVPSGRSEVSAIPEKAEVRIECLDSDNPGTETNNKHWKPVVSEEHDSL
ncbi:unnamed protein product [Heterobilharzia americana]|nr:unnamed protein product [Heterobilharzia americana]